jgi:hypothetical protein
MLPDQFVSLTTFKGVLKQTWLKEALIYGLNNSENQNTKSQTSDNKPIYAKAVRTKPCKY